MRVLIISLAMILLPALTLHAGELGHYQPGIAPQRDWVVGAPGFYYEQYNVFYTSSTFKNGDGNAVNAVTIGNQVINLNFEVDLIGVSPTLLWVPGIKILGATYVSAVSLYVGNPSVQAAVRAVLKRPTTIRLSHGLGFAGPEGYRSVAGHRCCDCFATLGSHSNGMAILVNGLAL